jgi:hypothetical protein
MKIRLEGVELLPADGWRDGRLSVCLPACLSVCLDTDRHDEANSRFSQFC